MESDVLSNDTLLVIGALVFLLMLIGLVLTVYEFGSGEHHDASADDPHPGPGEKVSRD